MQYEGRGGEGRKVELCRHLTDTKLSNLTAAAAAAAAAGTCCHLISEPVI